MSTGASIEARFLQGRCSEVWAKQQAQSQSVLAAPVKELVNKITNPFVTAPSDCQVPQASFFGDHLLLVGDALGLFRPHIAQNTNQAATDCMLLEKVLKGEMDFSEWEKQVMQYTHITRMRSNVIGTHNLSGYLVWRYHDIRYRVAVAAQRWGFIIQYLGSAGIKREYDLDSVKGRRLIPTSFLAELQDIR